MAHYLLLPLLIVLLAPLPSPQRNLPPLAKTVRGESNFGAHVMIYGDHDYRFLWGIIVPKDTMKSISYSDVPAPHCTVELRSGISLEFVKDDVTITNGTAKKTLPLKPHTVYLVQDNLSLLNSSDLSGIKLVLQTEYDSDDEPCGTAVAGCDVPENVFARFGKQGF
jgi:hypothetical protein